MIRPARLLPSLAAAAALLWGSAGAAAAAPALHPSSVGEDANGPAVFRFPQGIAVTPDGGGLFVADQYSGRVQAFGPQGQFRFGFGSRAVRREPGRFGVVGGVAVDRSGHVFVLDSENNRIEVFSAADGRYLTTFGQDAGLLVLKKRGRADQGIVAGGIAVYQASASTSIVVYVADGGHHRIARFVLDPQRLTPYAGPTLSPPNLGLRYPQGVGVGPGGRRLYVPDNQNHRIQVLDPRSMKRLAVFGTRGSRPGQFESPYDVAIDARRPHQLYVADNLNGRINVFDATTDEYVGTFGGPGHRVGRFSIVRAVAAAADDRRGGVAVADTANNRIQTVGPTGDVTGAWGISGRGPGYVTRPRGVTFAPDGGVAIADTFDHRIELIGPDGTYVGLRGLVSNRTGFASPGSRPGQYKLPEAVAYDGAGRTWIADTGNRRVVALDGAGTVVYTSRPGEFQRPAALAVSPGGSVYVADRTADALKRIAPGGAVETVTNRLTDPDAVAVAPDGRILVGDRHTIRDATTDARITPPGATQWQDVSGLAVAPDGTLYVSEIRPAAALGSRVLRGVPQAGAYAWDTVATEGTGPAQVIEPQGLAVSGDGRTLLVADSGNDRVLRFDAPGAGPPPTNPLTVDLTAGAALGRISSDPGGIDCATDCTQRFGPGRTVTLTARPTRGSVFGGWTGDCAGASTGPTCTIAMDRARRVGASFAVPPPPPVRMSPIRLSPRRLHLTRPRRHTSAQRRATRARLTLRLTQPARTTLRVQVARRGRTRHGRCRAYHGSAHRGNCTRFPTKRGTRVLRLLAGSTTLDLSPRAIHRTLGPGLYRLVATAKDAGGHTAVRHGPRFRIIR